MKNHVFAVLLPFLFSGSLCASEIDLWREPVPVVKAGKYQSIILDRGKLTKAVRNSQNEYVFSEKGAGVKPLVLIGTPTQVIDFLLENESRGIENHIEALPDIYMGVSSYAPSERFSGLFPLNDIFIKAVENVQKFLPVGTDITDAAGTPSDVKEMYQKIHELNDKQKSQGKVLYVKFSYLPEKGMQKIGKNSISFGKILRIMEKK